MSERYGILSRNQAAKVSRIGGIKEQNQIFVYKL